MKAHGVYVALAVLFGLTQATALLSDVLTKRTTCSTPNGSGTCKEVSSCSGFHIAGYCPGSSSNQCCIIKDCFPPSSEGICRNTGSGCSGGKFVSGYCPGDSTIQCCVGQSCTTPDGSGHCKATGSCSTFSVSGYCPGSSDYQCCVSKTCSTPKGSGTCKSTSKGCSGGTFVAGYCPGPDTVQCCVPKASTSTTTKSTTSTKATTSTSTSKTTTTTSKTTSSSATSTTCADYKGFDFSSAQSSSFWSCAAKDYSKAIIRGYQQACGSGGFVDPSFADSYNAAKAAGFKNFDAYMFPCTGTPPSGCGDSACKSPAAQISAFEAAVKASGMTPVHLWLDVEPETASSCSGCNAWNLGSTANTALAKEFVAIMRNSTYKWGIYANGNQWSGMFGTRDRDIGSDLPLWAVQFDKTPGVSTVDTFMGGWTKAYAKQYYLSYDLCGGTDNVDLDSFCG